MNPFRAHKLSAVLMLVAIACSPPSGGHGLGSSNVQCTQSSECAGGQVCLPNGSCGAQCSSNSACGSGQKCSTANACVAATACGSDTDCGSGQICGTDSKCGAACTATTCGAGLTCNYVGHCSDAKPPSNPSNSNVPDSCGGQLFETTPVQANFLIVLDHSGSMRETVGGQSKWASATSAVREITSEHERTIRFGLNMFSFASPTCDAGRTIVGIDDNNAAEISQALPSVADGNRTPIGGALQVASGNAGLKDATRSNNVLLITDGKENCNGDPVAQTRTLFGMDVKTYVIGFGGEVDQGMLSSMALEGGTARSGPVKYYQADDPTALDAALAAIARAGLGCELKLTQAPPDASKLFVYVNGSLQPRDASKQNGWDYDSTARHITLYGTSCGLVTNDAKANVSVVYGCPDGALVEGAPGSFCGANEHCSSGRCTAGLCEAPSGQKPGGEICGADPECTSGRCTNGRCEQPSGGAPGGAACSGHPDCASGTCTRGICEGSQNTQPDGAACASSLECSSRNCVNNVCAPGAKPGGAACAGNLECMSGKCTNQVCESPLPPGSPCTANAQCDSGVCMDNVCAPILG